jgi:diacylglycerol kinase family enzyme
MSYFLLINPNAKKNKKTAGKDIESYAKNLFGNRILTYITNSKEEVFNDFPRKFIKSGAEYLLVSGGDGSLHLAITSLIREIKDCSSLPKVFIVPSGTMNILSKTTKLPKNPLKALYKFYVYKSKGKELNIHRIPYIAVNGFYGILFGLGVAVNFMDYYYDKGAGYNGLIRAIFRVIMDVFLKEKDRKILHSNVFTVKSEDFSLVSEKLLISLILNVPKMPLGFRLYDKVLDKDFFSILLTYGKPYKYLFNLFNIYFGRRFFGVDLYYKIDTKKITFIADMPIPYILDGDKYIADNGVIEIEYYGGIKFLGF